MSNTYTPTRANYYQKNKEIIKAKRKQKYYENIEAEKATALERHQKNKKRNNKKSLVYYHNNSAERNKKRQKLRSKQLHT